MFRDIKDNVDVANSLPPLNATNARTGTGVDLQGYDAAMMVLHVGLWTGGTHTPSLQDSTDNTTFAAVASSNLQGSFTAITGTAQSNTVQRVGYNGGNRYVRAFTTVGNATDICATAAVIVRSHANRKPLA